MRIGEALIKSGLITREELLAALEEQKGTASRLGDILMEKGFISSDKMNPFLAEYFSIPFINIKEVYKNIQPEVVDLIPADLARKYHAIAIDLKDSTLIVAISDPLNLKAVDALRIKTGKKIQCVVADVQDIDSAIEYCYLSLPRLASAISSFIDLNEPADTPIHTLEETQFEASDKPVVQYVRSLIIQAVESRASDVLIQPKQDVVDLRFRVDGILCQIDPPPKVMLPAITTRIKILAGLDIAEKRLPQDGRFKVCIGRNTIDIRTSTFPTIYGESVVMRLLDTSATLLGLDQLGLAVSEVATLRRLINHSYGLILVTGPTGSGKTTTLYTCLNEIKSAKKNIITLEDPVEYRLPFIQQTQVNAAIGLDFARGLRSILRQDPDIIMVGEIRDRETAEIAINAALTGHLVFSTLHTNDAASAPVRLVNMGVEPYLITSALIGVVAQRLIRRICPACREIMVIDNDLRAGLGVPNHISELWRGRGCPKCIQTGYRGRLGVYEILVPDPAVRKYILDNRSGEDIKSVAQKSGFKSLRQACLEKLLEGVTTPEEVLRVSQETTDV